MDRQSKSFASLPKRPRRRIRGSILSSTVFVRLDFVHVVKTGSGASGATRACGEGLRFVAGLLFSDDRNLLFHRLISKQTPNDACIISFLQHTWNKSQYRREAIVSRSAKSGSKISW